MLTIIKESKWSLICMDRFCPILKNNEMMIITRSLGNGGNMDKLLLNKRLIKKNKAIKKAQKNSLKRFGKATKPVIKNKLGKVVECESYKANKSKVVSGINISKEQLLQYVSQAQLTGLSGGGFPVISKLESFVNSTAKRKIILVNGAECEIGLVHDQWLIENYFDEITEGIRIISQALGIKEKVLAAKRFPKENDKDIDVLGITLYKVPMRYPIGEEHVLIKQVLNQNISNDKVPSDNGILVMNVQTVYAIYNICAGTYENGRFVTLADIDNAKALAVYIKYGEKIKDKLIELFGERKEYYAGHGIMASHEITDSDVFDTTTAFACVANVTANNSNSNKCKHCGACKRVCPENIDVKKIVSLRENNPTADISGLGLERCLHCNSCSFVCSAQKNLFEYFN